MSRKIVALLQARTDSNRLPKKVLKIILDKPMIIHQLQRTQKSKYIDRLIVVTSDQESDNELVKTIIRYGFEIYRGSKNNVLKRFYSATSSLNLKDSDIIVRLTGDCPLHDATIIDEAIEAFIKSDCDYLTNSIEPIYPDGLDVEVFNFRSLRVAYLNAKLNSELEHVTPYIRDSGEFTIKNLEKEPIYSNWRLTVDEESDFILINKIYKHFNSTLFSFNRVIEFLEQHQELLNINGDIARNEGYLKSLKEDNDN
jgi:spore coat polysaccharide biosynthesis protein SpsF (cytidylyltransferase family)